MTLDHGQDFAHRFDLDQVAYTTLGSGLFIRRTDGRLHVHRVARYGPEDLAVLRILGPDGEVAVAEAGPLCITFDGGARLFVTAEDAVAVELPDGFRVEPEGAVRLLTGEDEVAHAVDEAAQDLGSWLARCPEAADEFREVTRFCWWLLGANTLWTDAREGLNRLVTWSKVGALAVSPGDAGNAAIGLRHGDLDLAIEQLRIALDHQGEDGKPLAGGPPLTALTLYLLEQEAGSGLVDECLPAVLTAQEWWHSGGAGAVAPDLTSYLALSDNLLANWLWERGDHDARARCQERAEAAVGVLGAMWDADAGFFRTAAQREDPAPSETIASLMPLIVDGLPGEMVAGLLAAIEDPRRFATPRPLPTVAVRDTDFTHTERWRGPVSVTTNWLVATALRARGHLNLAERLERATVGLVADHGAHEYYRPDTGDKPPAAMPMFTSSAALTVDLAVRLSTEGQSV